MKNKLIFLLLIGLILYFPSCMHSYDDKRISVLNLSRKSIYIVVSYSDEIIDSDAFSNYNINKQHLNFIDNDKLKFIHCILPKNKGRDDNSAPYWFNFNDEHKISLFIISYDSVAIKGWSTILKDNNFLKKIKFTKKELEELNWEVTYK